MTNLPARPDIDQLRHQARDLLRAARSGDPAAAARIAAVADSMTLAAAQLAVAREHGFASWPRLKAEVEARSSDLAEQVDAFLEASIRDWTGRAARILAATPQIAGYDFRTAVVLGDADQVRQMLEHDQGRATRPDPRWGWTPLHAVCASRWHRLDPRRADGLLSVAGLLLDAGADPAARKAGRQGDWTPLRCAVAGTANPAIARLLLERGATPDDHDLYLACFADDDHQSLRLLLDHAHNVQHTTALAAPISAGDTEAVRLLLQAGADPSRPLPGDLFGERVPAEPPIPPVAAAAQSECPAELVGLLLDAGGDPDAPAQDGHSPYRIAIRQGRTDIAQILAQHDGCSGPVRICPASSAPTATPRWSRPPATARQGRCGSCSMLVSRWRREARTARPRCTPPPAPAALKSSGCCSTAAPTSRHAIPPGTAHH
jgi:hypothetical protein